MGRMVGCAVATVFLASCANPLVTAAPSPETEFAEHVRAQPTMPVVVPRSLPEGYELGGGPTWQAGPDGQVFMASWEYIPTPSEEVGLPVVTVCVARPQVNLEDVCVPSNHEPVATRMLGDLSVAIVPIGPGPDHAAVPDWATVDLTTAWDDVDWLRD